MTRFISVVIALLAVACAILFLAANGFMQSPIKELTASETIVIEEGATLGQVAQELAGRKLLNFPIVFKLWARQKGIANQIKAGEYEMEPGSSPRDLLNQFVAGAVVLHSFTIVEGWTVKDLTVALEANDLIKKTLNYESPETLAQGLGLKWPHAEGLFFPDTYRVPRNISDRELLSKAAALMQSKLDAAWAQRAEVLPVSTPYELLTLASVIERETALPEERPTIAGVFVRRLTKRMRLQTDPTVIYGLGKDYAGNLTRAHLITDTPYNTYTRFGLPPTPIAMPGEAALRAAANPADGEALYFVATGDPDGSHNFSATLEQHNAAVAAYISRLRQQRATVGGSK